MEFHLKANLQKGSEENGTNSVDEFPCLSIFLPILQNEYEQERTRSDRIDNKAMALLTAVIALVTIYVPIFPFDKLAECYSKSKDCWILPVILSFFLLLGVIAICLAVHCVTKLTQVYKPAEYQAVNIAQLNSDDKLSQNPPTKFQMDLIEHYQSIILTNSAINSDKSKKLSKQFAKSILIFVLLSASAIGTLICIGI